MRTLEFRVGLLVTTILSIVISILFVVGDDFSNFRANQDFHFFLDDANGITKKSKVKLAGLDIGYIGDIELVKNRAKINLVLSRKDITTDAFVEVRDDGLLGDRYITIINGTSNELLQTNQEITKVIDGGTFDRAIDKIASIASTVEMLPSLLGESNNTTSPLINTIKNLETMTRALSEVTTKHKDELSNLLVSMNRITNRVDNGLEDWDGSWDRIMKSIDNMDIAFENIKDITEKIQKGEGGLGKLIQEDETVDNINTAVSGISDLVKKSNEMKTALDLRGDYFTSDMRAKTNLSIIIQPREERQFEASIVDIPVEGNEGKIKFSALYEERFYDLAIKAGIIENTVGAGLSYFALPKLKLTLESFRLAENFPRLRSYLKYGVTNGVYLTSGMDRLLQTPSFFVGLGIVLSNDDLKTLFLLP